MLPVQHPATGRQRQPRRHDVERAGCRPQVGRAHVRVTSHLRDTAAVKLGLETSDAVRAVKARLVCPDLAGCDSAFGVSDAERDGGVVALVGRARGGATAGGGEQHQDGYGSHARQSTAAVAYTTILNELVSPAPGTEQ